MGFPKSRLPLLGVMRLRQKKVVEARKRQLQEELSAGRCPECLANLAECVCPQEGEVEHE